MPPQTNLPSSTSPSVSSESQTPFDHLADLFLGESDGDAQSSPTAAGLAPGSAVSDRWAGPRSSNREPIDRPLEIEILMASHLPVMAGPWVDQAAGVMAVAEERPVLLVRQRDVAMTVDLFPGRHRVEPAETEMIESVITTAPDSLHEAHLRLQAMDPCWVMRISEAHHLDRLRDLPVTRVTVLTGADQAAVVATYRLFKQLVPYLGPTTRLGLIVVGSSAEDAGIAASKIDEVVGEFLNRGVELLAVVPRMTPVTVKPVARFLPDGDPVAWLCSSMLHEAIADPTPVAPDQSTKTEEPPIEPREIQVPEICLAPQLRLTREEEEIPVSPVHALLAEAEAAELEAALVEEPSVPPQIKTSAPPAEEDTPLERAEVIAEEASPATVSIPSEGSPGSLVDYVEDLVRLDVRCPKVPEVEVAVSRDGQLHLLARDTEESRVASLLIARDWAIEHAGIIRQICPFVSENVRDGVSIHLFTATPKERCGFIDGSWRIHLLVPGPGHEKEATPGPGWLHVELN